MPVFFDQKHTKGPTNPVDEIDRARRKASRNFLAAFFTKVLPFIPQTDNCVTGVLSEQFFLALPGLNYLLEAGGMKRQVQRGFRLLRATGKRAETAGSGLIFAHTHTHTHTHTINSP
jgi:hypothetical protein